MLKEKIQWKIELIRWKFAWWIAPRGSERDLLLEVHRSTELNRYTEELRNFLDKYFSKFTRKERFDDCLKRSYFQRELRFEFVDVDYSEFLSKALPFVERMRKRRAARMVGEVYNKEEI